MKFCILDAGGILTCLLGNSQNWPEILRAQLEGKETGLPLPIVPHHDEGGNALYDEDDIFAFALWVKTFHQELVGIPISHISTKRGKRNPELFAADIEYPFTLAWHYTRANTGAEILESGILEPRLPQPHDRSEVEKSRPYIYFTSSLQPHFSAIDNLKKDNSSNMLFRFGYPAHLLKKWNHVESIWTMSAGKKPIFAYRENVTDDWYVSDRAIKVPLLAIEMIHIDDAATNGEWITLYSPGINSDGRRNALPPIKALDGRDFITIAPN